MTTACRDSATPSFLIRRRANGKPIVIGGPDVTSSPDVYSAANFQVLGETEEIMADFIAA